MWLWRKHNSRRAEIRRNRPESRRRRWEIVRRPEILLSLLIAAFFCTAAAAILLLREEVVSYRPGQYVLHPIHSRVDFSFRDKAMLMAAQEAARQAEPRVYRQDADRWAAIEQDLRRLPDLIAGNLDALPASLRDALDAGAITALRGYRAPERRPVFEQKIESFLAPLRGQVVVPVEQLREDLHRDGGRGQIIRLVQGENPPRDWPLSTVVAENSEALAAAVQRAARAAFREGLQAPLTAYVLASLSATHRLDEAATTEARNAAAARVPAGRANIPYKINQIIKDAGEIKERDWQILRNEHEAYLAGLDGPTRWRLRGAAIGFVVLVTALLGVYIGRYQPRIIRNHARAVALALLLLSMQLLAQLAGIGTGPLYLYGLAPTLLVAMIVTIAYDRRFAMGVALFHALLVTAGLNQGVGFLLILLIGAFTACILLDEVRTRSKLVEVGGATAVAMMLATLSAGALPFDPVEPLEYLGRNALHAGAAGLGVGFVVLGILPFIEKTFRITTSMTLLELADASQPLLRRLQQEAPGTYSHSLQVAALAESAAEAVGANSLLCRVGSMYHDIGKINKPDYFCENQFDGQNRHLNLSPSVSLLIIVGHVKDGLELAREYNLPTSLFSFIQQHHGTTLVEYFYHRACHQQGTEGDEIVSDSQYRYSGPKPRSREVAIVMLADAVESACRAAEDPTSSRLESLVHELAMKRLLDGQFDECDLTLRDLDVIEKSLTKTLLGIYHARVAYPPAETAAPQAVAKTA